MSGPKYSSVELQRRERERLKNERRKLLEIKQREHKEAINAFVIELHELDLFKKEIEDICKDNGLGADEDIIETANQLYAEIKACKQEGIGTTKEIIEKTNNIKNTKQKIKKQLDRLHCIYSERRDFRMISQAKLNVRREIEEVYQKKMNDRQDDLFVYEKIISNTEILEDILPKDRKVIENFRLQLANLLEVQGNLYEIKQVALNLETRIEVARKRFKEWNRIYNDYILRVELLGIKRKGMEEFESIVALENEIQQLDAMAEESDRMSYIAYTIEEVMKKYGHNVIRSDIITIQNQRFQREYYSFGDDGVISVMQNVDGAVVMEVSVLGREEGISELDKRRALEKMLCFCNQYPEMVEELNQKGIIFKKNYETPVDENCVSKVTDVEIMDTIIKQKRRRRINGKANKEM